MARKKKGKPTSHKRARRQRVRERHQKWREEAQLIGVVPTVPEGASRDERVDPATQGAQPLPGLIGRAVRNGYATPDHMKIIQVDELHQIATDPEIDAHTRVAAIRTAQQADKDQWERDNPELAGKTKGGGVKVDVGVTNQLGIIGQEQLVEMLMAPEGGPEHPIERKLLEGKDENGAADLGGQNEGMLDTDQTRGRPQ